MVLLCYISNICWLQCWHPYPLLNRDPLHLRLVRWQIWHGLTPSLFHFLQERTHLQWIVAPRPSRTLVDNFPSLQHVKPLGQSAILYGSDIVHFIHNHRTQGLLLNQDLGCRQPLLQAPVLVDVKVVGKSPTVCWMCLGDVDHKKVSYIAEVLDELLELLKFVDKRGSGAASKTQHQRSVVFQVLADTCFLSLHVDNRWVRSLSSFKSLLSERQPHVLRHGFKEAYRGKCQTPILILKIGILGHGRLFTHSEDRLLVEAWRNKMHDTDYKSESYHIAKQAYCR